MSHLTSPVSVIIPAYNEQSRIGQTLSALIHQRWIGELIVVDDGSTDLTCHIASEYTKQVLTIPKNVGKAEALRRGSLYARGSILLFLDADLEESAQLAQKLLKPIWNNQADMTIAVFPPPKHGGYGLVKKFAKWGIYHKTGQKVESPLCGQRAISRKVFHSCYRGDRQFGIEVGLTLDCLMAGYRVKEVEIPFQHRELGKTYQGFRHRLKQGYSVCQALMARKSSTS